MLVLSRKVNQRITIANNIVITVIEVRGGKVRLGIEAPRDIAVLRDDAQTTQKNTTVPVEPDTEPPSACGITNDPVRRMQHDV